MIPDDLKIRRAKKVVDVGVGNQHAIPLANLTESIITNDKLDELIQAISDIPVVEIPEQAEMPEYPTEISINNLPEIQRVEVINQQEAPIVNVSPQVVNVEAPIVNINQDLVVNELEKITAILSKEEEDKNEEETVKQAQVLGSDGQLVDFKELFEYLGDKISKIRTGGSSLAKNLLNKNGIQINPATEDKQDTIINNSLGDKPLTGSASFGMVDMADTDVWYQVPDTIPTVPYVLIATIEQGYGDIRMAFGNNDYPYQGEGIIAPKVFTVKLGANQCVYYGTTYNDDLISWVAKEI